MGIRAVGYSGHLNPVVVKVARSVWPNTSIPLSESDLREFSAASKLLGISCVPGKICNYRTEKRRVQGEQLISCVTLMSGPSFSSSAVDGGEGRDRQVISHPSNITQ